MIVIIPLMIVIGALAWVLRPGKKPTIPRRNSVLITVIPALLVSVAAVIFQLLYNATGTIEVSNVSNISNTLFLVSLGLIGAYIFSSVSFAVARKGDVAKGTAFGACVAVILTITELGLLEWLGGV